MKTQGNFINRYEFETMKFHGKCHIREYTNSTGGITNYSLAQVGTYILTKLEATLYGVAIDTHEELQVTRGRSCVKSYIML